MATLKIIAFQVALRFSVAITRFALFIERKVLVAPSDATFDATMESIKNNLAARRKGVDHG